MLHGSGANLGAGDGLPLGPWSGPWNSLFDLENGDVPSNKSFQNI